VPHRRIVLLATAAGVALICGPAQAATPRDSLYVQQAASGALIGDKLVLSGVARRTVRFDDRPGRTGGVLSVRGFVRTWRSSFAGSPPNAALVVHNAPAARDVALLELRRPRYNRRRRTLTFAVRRLRQTGSDRLKGFARRSDGRRVRRFGSVELLIDPSAAAAEIAFLMMDLPANTTGRVSFSNTTITYDGTRTGVSQAGIRTPGRLVQGGSIETAVGTTTLTPSSITLESISGAGITIQFLMLVNPPPGGTLTGTASVPSGADVEFGFSGQAAQQLPHGSFSIPFPGG
jgi:hypothetical protein